MKISDYEVFNATNYFTMFECDKDDKMRLLSYLSWLVESDITGQILADTDYGPSGQWQEWLQGNFVAFSERHIMYKGGHRFYHSYSPFFFPAYWRGSIRDNLKFAYAAARRWMTTERSSPDQSRRLFREFYPEVRIPDVHEELVRFHHGAYFRALEANVLAGEVERETILEIGAGSGINPILNFLQHGSASVIIDLPETVAVAFAFVRSCAPEGRIALPNDVQAAIDSGKKIETLVGEFDFVFMLPIQISGLGEDFADLAFNTASFQEMEISVVRNYIDRLHQCLKPSGRVSLLNLETSRQIEGNAMSAYGLERFTNGDYIDARFANSQISGLKSLKYVCYVGNK